MKKLLLTLLMAYFSVGSFAQATSAKTTDKQTVDPRISEVYAEQLQTYVLNDKDRLNGLNDILNNRAKIQVEKAYAGEKYPKLSSAGLNTAYNPDLKRDQTGAGFNPETFNVLKYDLPLYSFSTHVYRIDDTDYILVINPQTQKKP